MEKGSPLSKLRYYQILKRMYFVIKKLVSWSFNHFTSNDLFFTFCGYPLPRPRSWHTPWLLLTGSALILLNSLSLWLITSNHHPWCPPSICSLNDMLHSHGHHQHPPFLHNHPRCLFSWHLAGWKLSYGNWSQISNGHSAEQQSYSFHFPSLQKDFFFYIPSAPQPLPSLNLMTLSDSSLGR